MNSMRCVLSAALVSCVALSAGCKKEAASASSAPSSPEATPEVDQAAAPKGAEPAAQPDSTAAGEQVVALGSSGKSKVAGTSAKTVAETPTYKVTLAAPAKVGKGAQATAMLEILPKEGWKLNKEFPTKLTVVEPAGVKVSKKEQTVADAVAFADKSGKWSVDFQADSAGAKSFTGVVKFAVCTETSCDPKKEQLAWSVAVAD
ncbi:MAG TPA: hypothetical protein VNO33_23310 [Kofleriaceae bacterium]|nr:hypothetical protein [Kofleriaceae bacterium]